MLRDTATIVPGDALDPVAVTRALAGCEGVISALGPTKLSPLKEVTLLSDSTRVLVEAMQAQGVRRLVAITGMGAGDSRGQGGFLYDRLFQPLLLGPIYKDKDRQEAIIRSSGLDWTIMRPSVLTDGQETETVRVLTDLQDFHGGKISRIDVARCVVAEFERQDWKGQAPIISQ
ncbi:putative NADH-flavin reductase [Pseudoroseicyclus aestuarii]|uniref:Putative NADH-flavin reductase n=1 Tax=Pseudoroseicyclus aestuarii TaxID=1795041 RepID=A0A318SY45_9RHOB|nr:putative NADH-flavin reductase [Pseudoroseicyclus aestuarii]